MDRPACIDVPALPLQILARRHPSWRGLPFAVIDRDTPQGVLSVARCSRARKRLRPGMRYAEALSVAPDLRADVVSPDAVAAAVETIARRLQDFSPIVETAPDTPGVFWSNAAGLSLLYPTLHDWARVGTRRPRRDRLSRQRRRRLLALCHVCAGAHTHRNSRRRERVDEDQACPRRTARSSGSRALAARNARQARRAHGRNLSPTARRRPARTLRRARPSPAPHGERSAAAIARPLALRARRAREAASRRAGRRLDAPRCSSSKACSSPILERSATAPGRHHLPARSVRARTVARA